MPRTPPRTHPTRPLTISECVRHGKEKRKAEAKAKAGWLAAFCRAEPTLGCSSIRYRIVDSDTDSSTHDVDLPCRPRSTPTSSRELSEAGRCGLAGPLAPWARGMPRAGWAGCPTPALPCAQDSAHEQGAIEPPGTGLRRVLPTHTAPPSRGLPAVAVASAVASAGAGCNPAEPLPQGQAGGAATHACCTSASDARSSSRHCGSSCP